MASELNDLLRELRNALWSEHLTGLPLLEHVRDDLIKQIDALSSPNNHASSPTGEGTASHLPRRATDDELRAWIERHDLGSMSLTDARCVFEDAQSLHLADGVPVIEKESRRAEFDEWFRKELGLSAEADTTNIAAAYLPYRAWCAALGVQGVGRG